MSNLTVGWVNGPVVLPSLVLPSYVWSYSPLSRNLPFNGDWPISSWTTFSAFILSSKSLNDAWHTKNLKFPKLENKWHELHYIILIETISIFMLNPSSTCGLYIEQTYFLVSVDCNDIIQQEYVIFVKFNVFWQIIFNWVQLSKLMFSFCHIHISYQT